MRPHSAFPFLTAGLLFFTLVPPALAEMPVLPCAGQRVEFPVVGTPALIRVYKEADIADWKPPACTGWAAEKFEFIGTLAANFRHSGDTTELLQRYAAISDYAAMRYFSPRRQAYRALAFSASALQDASPLSKRGDFSAAELMSGTPHYFWQRGATEAPPPLPGSIDLVNRIDILERTPDRLVVAVGSEPGTVALVMRLARGDIRNVYFLERDPDNRELWHYFALTSLSGIAALGADDFYRASARGVFRHTVGLPAEVKEASP